MNNQFLFLDYEKRRINDKEFIVIDVLEFSKKQIFRIYKSFDTNLVAKLDNFKNFENFNNYITFAIKRDGKISLDIKL